MSLGSVLGGVAGGIIGFFVGGPMGAVYGAGFGFAAGFMLDPLTPDANVAGAPLPTTQVMVSTIGDPIPDLNGTALIVGHLLLFGKERTAEITQTQEPQGGKGSEPDPITQVVGYNYYMSWAVGIVKGPITTIYTIYADDDIVWDGELEMPVSGGQETIVLEGMGSCVFYFGSDDQMPNTKVGEIIGDATLNTPLRGLCWAFMDDCLIGSYNRTPTMKFVVKKIPEVTFYGDNQIQTYDYNPISSIWYILSKLSKLPESWLNTVSFVTAANTVYYEFRGISILYDSQQSVLYYIEMINNHIDNILRYGSDGAFHPKLIRNDYVAADLPLIDEDVMLDDPAISSRSWIDTINEIRVQYTELITDPVTERDEILAGFLFGSGVGYNAYDPPYHVYEFSPDPILTGSGLFSEIAVGGSIFFAIKTNGVMYSRGGNNSGQLGLGDNTYRADFTQVTSATSWAKVSAGSNFCWALQQNGSLYMTGDNTYGVLAQGDLLDENVFTRENSNSSWIELNAGRYHGIALKADGTLWGCGRSFYGELGLNISGLSAVVMEMTQELSLSSWECIAAGTGTSFAIKSDGTLWCCGYNNYGQLGLNDFTNRRVFTQVGTDTDWDFISCGAAHTIARKTNGTIWTTGYNAAGQLGLGDNTNRKVFTQVGTDSDWSKIISCGWNFTLVVKNDGTLWGTGVNGYGQLGLGTNTSVNVFTQEITNRAWVLMSCDESAALAVTLNLEEVV